MGALSVPTWLANAAAVLCRRRGAPTERANESGCSRQTVYNHSHRLQAACADGIPDPARLERLESENAELRREVERLRAAEQSAVPIGGDELRRFVVTAEASGISLRQSKELLGTLLPKDRVPGHARLGRWTAEAGARAAALLEVLDPAVAKKTNTLAVDEIFFGGSRPSSESNRRA
jgi:hypothetical protein